ncbi:hypothetical protein [Mycolicibacterium lutetiense]
MPTSVAAQRQWCFDDWQVCARGERSYVDETVRRFVDEFLLAPF